tara:strand:+ start:2425 stop:2949 length:525 start_codon:yes stop_codon:yes gene_type:complete
MIFDTYTDVEKYNKIYMKVYKNYLEVEKIYIYNKHSIECRGTNLTFEEKNYFTSKYKCSNFKYPYCICWRGYNSKNTLEISDFIKKNQNNPDINIINCCRNNKKQIYMGNRYFEYILFNDTIDICYRITDELFKKWKNNSKLLKKYSNIKKIKLLLKYMDIWLDDENIENYTLI